MGTSLWHLPVVVCGSSEEKNHGIVLDLLNFDIADTFLNDKTTVLGASGLVVTLRAAPETWYTTHNLEQGVSFDSEQVL